MRFQAALAAALVLAACSGKTPGTTQQAALRNDPPATCTPEQMSACPAATVEPCADGTQPVLDYSSDCCAHFSCQPVCQAAKPCARTPAPACPAGSNLWIGTALEDCCPAYRCNPSTKCDSTAVACTLAMPSCGDGVTPVVVGKTSDCCPIYQCPCDPNAGAAPPTVVKPCGCTFPNCKPGEEMVCAGSDPCGGPCSCVPAHGTCTSDTQCSSTERCDKSQCLLSPSSPTDPPACDPAKCGPQLGMLNKLCEDGKTMAGPTGRCLANSTTGNCAWEITTCPTPAPVCDAAKCGPALGMPNKLCEDGKTMSGPTGRCLADSAGKCGWEIIECPPTPVCFGICVPNVQSGCRANTDCPSGQTCEIACEGWGCATACACASTDPTCNCQPSTTPCSCPASDPTCKCDSAGICSGQVCKGQCVSPPPKCDPAKPVACPALALQCPDGGTPIQVGTDPTTCCPKYQCPVCSLKASAGQAIACPLLQCACGGTTVGTDPTTCCPKVECKLADATGKCL
jgi:hypothetical protein